MGIIDGDYHPAAFLNSLPATVNVLKVHEVESLLALPHVVEAVCARAQALDQSNYLSNLLDTIDAKQRQSIIVSRWKRRVEPHLEGLVAGVSRRDNSVEDLIVALPEMFTITNWSFSPEGFLGEERDRVEAGLALERPVDLHLSHRASKCCRLPPGQPGCN